MKRIILFFLMMCAFQTDIATANDLGRDVVVNRLKETYAGFLQSYRIFKDNCVFYTMKSNLATRDLQGLLVKEWRCTEKHGMCNLDWDFLINGQDNCKQFKLKISEVYKKEGNYFIKVSTGCRGQLPYELVLKEEQGKWLIDDGYYYDDGGKVTKLKDVLRGVGN